MIASISESVSQAFGTPVTAWMVGSLTVLLVVTPVVFEVVRLFRKPSPAFMKELYLRYLSWLVLVPCMVVPILLGRLWTVGAVLICSLLCYREFARATGFFRNWALSLTVVLAIVCIFAAAADHWYGFFVALPSLALAVIVVVALLADRPDGYIQRVDLAAMAMLFFGVCLGHFAYFANDRQYQAIMLLILICVELNDIFAFCCGKMFGRRKLCPGTSPNKTVAGAVGAALLTTALYTALAAQVLRPGPAGSILHLVLMGLFASLTGQCGDLVISSIKRDLGLKDMGQTLPGHGGFLDRFDSLLFVGPVLFHYIGYLRGIGLDRAVRVFTGD